MTITARPLAERRPWDLEPFWLAYRDDADNWIGVGPLAAVAGLDSALVGGDWISIDIGHALEGASAWFVEWVEGQKRGKDAHGRPLAVRDRARRRWVEIARACIMNESSDHSSTYRLSVDGVKRCEEPPDLVIR
jgi:hypothetical protein